MNTQKNIITYEAYKKVVLVINKDSNRFFNAQTCGEENYTLIF